MCGAVVEGAIIAGCVKIRPGTDSWNAHVLASLTPFFHARSEVDPGCVIP
jgi:hypothetical protein